MKERPILFSGPMVKAIMAGDKTQTRRVVKPQPDFVSADGVPGVKRTLTVHRNGRFIELSHDPRTGRPYAKILPPPWSPGDRLWVRETWCFKENPYNSDGEHDKTCVHYRADGYKVVAVDGDGFRQWNKDGMEASPWKPSIHMPRWASRITLEVVSVRVERLQDISPSDCIAEGVFTGRDEFSCDENRNVAARVAFWNLWDSINAKRGYGWDKNPWVWVVDFKKVKA